MDSKITKDDWCTIACALLTHTREMSLRSLDHEPGTHLQLGFTHRSRESADLLRNIVNTKLRKQDAKMFPEFLNQ